MDGDRMKLRSKVASGVLAFAAVAAVAIPVANKANEKDSTGGFFYSDCRYDHTAKDDPIVFPAQPGVSHSHDFFGAVGVDAFTKPADKVDGPNTCRDPQGAAYWVPTLYVNGEAVRPVSSSARYGLAGKDPTALQAFPPGLVVVAGRTKQTVEWNCKPPPRPIFKDKTVFHDCTGNAQSVVKITFPDCWDGWRLDAADHFSHMAYSNVKHQCPATHPVPVPQIQLKIHYPKNLPTAETVELASGIPATAHADFMNTWNQDRLEELVSYCLRGKRNCGEAATGNP